MIGNNDPVASWTLVFTIVGAFFAGAGAWFAYRSAKYGKEAPTKADLARVESHVASTSEHMKADRQRAEFELLVRGIPVSVWTHAGISQPVPVTITLGSEDASPCRASLLDERGAVYGTTKCEIRADSGNSYVAIFPSHSISQWYWSGLDIPRQPSMKKVSIRIIFAKGEYEVPRVVPIMLAYDGINWMINGQVS